MSQYLQIVPTYSPLSRGSDVYQAIFKIRRGCGKLEGKN